MYIPNDSTSMRVTEYLIRTSHPIFFVLYEIGICRLLLSASENSQKL